MEVADILGLMEGDYPAPILIVEQPGLQCAPLALQAAREWGASHVEDYSAERLVMSSSGSGTPIREATGWLSLKSSGKRALILNLNGSGFEVQNSLLKTLEEPPRETMIVLVAGSDYPVLATVMSRCRLLQARPLSPDEVKGYVEQHGVDLPAELISAAAGNPGRIGWIEENLEVVQALQAGRVPPLLQALQGQEDQAGWLSELLAIAQALDPGRDLSSPRLWVSSGVRPELVLAYAFLV